VLTIDAHGQIEGLNRKLRDEVAVIAPASSARPQ